MLKKVLLSINVILLLFQIISCEKKTRLVEIKLLILTPDNYYNFPVILSGKIYEMGPGGLWFILEDKTGYIQVTTENIPNKIPCIALGKEVTISGALKFFETHKYFSFSSLLRCGN